MQFLYFLSCFCLTSLSAYFSFFLTFPRYSDTHSPLLSLIITFFLFFTFSFSPSLSPFPFDFALFPLCRSGQKVIYWYLVYLNQTQNQIDCTKKKTDLLLIFGIYFVDLLPLPWMFSKCFDADSMPTAILKTF